MLHAFGDSFTYGYELSDCPTNTYPKHSMLTYSALSAKHLGLKYQCHAVGYSSNNGILRQIKRANIQENDTVMVMWTFAIRFAFMFAGERGWSTIEQGEDSWYWKNVDQTSEECLERSLDSILAAQTILDSIGANYIFLCNNIELQDKIQYNSLWLNKQRWFFLPNDHDMLNHTTASHPGDAIHRDVFNKLKDRLDG